MRKEHAILNPSIIAAITAVGHTDYFVIAYAGLPIPWEVQVIDLSLTKGVPSFMQVLDAVAQELIVENYIVAEEMAEKSGELYNKTADCLAPHEGIKIPHEEFKELIKRAKVVIRTGETTPYANVILIGGVSF